MRIFQMLPVPQILTAVGISGILHFVQNDKKTVMLNLFQHLLYFFSLFIFLFSFFSLYRNYFFVFPKEQSESFQYALKDSIFYVNQHQKEYDKIVFSNKNDLYQSYMFMLFYSQYDPKLYQEQGGTKSGGFAQAHQFSKFFFRPIHWDTEIKNKTLFIGNLHDFPENGEKSLVINYLDGRGGIKLVY